MQIELTVVPDDLLYCESGLWLRQVESEARRFAAQRPGGGWTMVAPGKRSASPGISD